MNLVRPIIKANSLVTVAGFIILQLLFINHRISGQDAIITDNRHYSSILGEIRNYRIFLPPGYHQNPEKRYPVIYYYHGWSQRYFGSISSFQADQGDSNNGDNIANFVAKNEVIVVKPDGYNRRPDEPYYLRPHNIGPVETHRQFPLYFPELIEHIDNNYRTIADREHRAISGLSMGGFMTFWIAGKYPHLVSAAGNFCGSTEFIIGPVDFPVEYRHQEMYKNYEGLNVRLNYGDKDFIRAYHKDMNKIWTQVMDNYEFEIYDAAHSTAGLGEMFTFLMKSFQNPPAKPAKWNHIDVYPSYHVWGYEVTSDRNVPGFTILENVNDRGFRSSSRTFLPDGELMPFVQKNIITSPVYEKNQLYQVTDINPLNGKSSVKSITSDDKGRLHITLNGNLHEIGINKKADKPNITIASHAITNRNWAVPYEVNEISVKLLNKGGGNSGQLMARLEPFRESTSVVKGNSTINNINAGEVGNSPATFSFLINNEEEIVRLKLLINDENGNEWNDILDIPVRANNPVISNFVIADGKEFDVAAAGDDTVSVFLGKGNGDGIANPGESIIILVNDEGRLFRTLLHGSDLFINPQGINIRESDYWGSYDHVGSSAKYSIPVLASEAPNGHVVKFLAEYWLPAYPDHIIKRAVVEFKIEGNDKTPPELRWVKMNGDNTFHVKLFDGGKIKTVHAKFELTNMPDMAEKPLKSFNLSLHDTGMDGDLAESDKVFGGRIKEMGFGLYKVRVEAEDIYGNKMVKDCDKVLVVH